MRLLILRSLSSKLEVIYRLDILLMSYKLITSKALGTMHAQHFFIAGSIYD